MTAPALTPRASDQESADVYASHPFATPTSTAAELPSPPEPAAQLLSKSQPHHVRGSSTRPPMINRPLSEDHGAYSHKSSAVSSTASSPITSPISSIDLEKHAMSREASPKKQGRTSRDRQSRHSRHSRHSRYSRHSRDRSSRDPEKAVHSPPHLHRNRRLEAEQIAYEYDDVDETRQMQEAKAVKILLYFSGPCVVLSFLNSIWTFITVIISLLAQPVRLCARRPSFGQQLGGLLGPALNLQLKSIYTPLPPHADEDLTYRPGLLVAVQLLSPFLSLGMMIAAWVVAVFWISSAVVGDPAGMDKRDDGKETVLSLRNWWERWLVRSMREELMIT
ncbi:hypothetical protein MYCFIDRAFT_210176 [Lecanosticta acicola]|uniref:Uncharacterized protein n=1 Tax=Lecanosticta acicola TaxID=111012 RepID=A0AAI8YUK8_9PEZI|nr:hypothetical protein MYCFIDRAFT_210176 [Lecanosticta acicola]